MITFGFVLELDCINLNLDINKNPKFEVAFVIELDLFIFIQI